ncbi:CaiB/BaiF CoA transferase family protein [Rhodococcus artemisiae]|uniref:CoA transferase n=1 Tax=Rhodococcus artemisiae TaxID=714159 RepID=A0ABU7LCS1_9NOCA|nr:CoA transferase [Rhodococcus artemisiae]MEE2059341.1 CoA transferase [Rhodococcus artemisiae]
MIEQETNTAPRAFDGVRVVELAQWVFVPVAAALLADWGADVVRIEPPDGDPYRGLATQGIGADRGGPNLSMALANRGKRSIALDVRTDEGITVLHELLSSADVFITSLRPGALARLGLDAETLRLRYPRLIYARGHGFGARGPDSDKPGYDSSAFWARGGVGHTLTPPERDYPISQRGAMGDRNGAMALAFGISTALHEREKTDTGTVVDVSLLATAMWMLSSDLLVALNGGDVTSVTGRGPQVNPLTGTYRTRDLRHIQLMFLQGDRYWPAFARLIGRDDLIDDPRFVDMVARRENSAACVEELDGIFAKHTLDEWKQILHELDAPWAPVQSVHDVIDDPQVAANRYIGEVRLDDGHSYRLPAVPVQLGQEPPALRRAPEHGEHTEAVLLELGYDWEGIGSLADKGVIP